MYIPENEAILNEVIAAYDFPETLMGAVRYGSGHINDTFCLVCQPQDTTVYTDNGSFDLHLEANEIRWYNL